MKSYFVSNGDVKIHVMDNGVSSGKYPSLRFGAVKKTAIEQYGAVTSVRVWFMSGLEVEFGITGPEWISRPLDTGTREVLKAGFRDIADKEGLFKGIEL